MRETFADEDRKLRTRRRGSTYSLGRSMSAGDCMAAGAAIRSVTGEWPTAPGSSTRSLLPKGRAERTLQSSQSCTSSERRNAGMRDDEHSRLRYRASLCLCLQMDALTGMSHHHPYPTISPRSSPLLRWGIPNPNFLSTVLVLPCQYHELDKCRPNSEARRNYGFPSPRPVTIQ